MITSRHAADFAFLLLTLATQYGLYRWARTWPRVRASLVWRGSVQGVFVLLCVAQCAAALLNYARVSRYFPLAEFSWFQGIVVAWAFFSVLLLCVAWWWKIPAVAVAAERRELLRTIRTASYAVPAVVLGYGMFVARHQLRLREVDVPVKDLPPDLVGLRLVQLTDIHMSPFLDEAELAQAVDLANEQKADLALVTGDLISRYRDPLDACLRQLARLRTTAGTYGCMGNHEVYAGSERYTQMAGMSMGMRFLRQERRQLRFGNATLNLAGVDYQKMQRPYLVGAASLVDPGPLTLNMLLSHNPDVFPTAQQQGWDVTVAGHTHGGQITVEILHDWVNPARFYTPFVDGLYTKGGAALYVSEGIGTIGLPARLGTRPEVALLRLCRA